MSGTRVCVGVDFSRHGEAALQWSTAHAARFGWDVEAVHAWSYPWWAAGRLGSAAEDARDEVIASANRHLQNFVERKLPHGAETPKLTVIEGDVAETLCTLSGDAGVVVIGSSGDNPVAAWLTGAVGRRLAVSSSVPVVVVPDSVLDEVGAADGSGVTPQTGPIVVGVDGSTNSVRALKWACDHSREGQEVHAVTSWTSNAAHLAGVVALDLDLMETSAYRQLEITLEKAVVDGVDVSEVVRRVVYGDPRVVLRDLSANAEMLVVGARGSSGLTSILVGSVASSLVHRPACPLIVVPNVEPIE